MIDPNKQWAAALPHFPAHELACKGTNIILIDIRFAVALPALRKEWGRPLDPSSVCRAPEYNAIINNGKGGHPNSLHLTENPKHPTWGTMAADLRWRGKSKEEQLEFARLAYSRGFSVGLHNGFCHIDLRAEVGLQKQVFLYGSWDGVFSPDDVERGIL